MRVSKRYLLFAALLIAVIMLKLNKWSDTYAAVEMFRGASLSDEVFYPLISKNLNDEGRLNIFINDENYVNSSGNVILSDGLYPVASLDFVRDVLYGSAYMQDDTSAIVQVGDEIYEFLDHNATALKDGDDYTLVFAPVVKNGQMYISTEDLCNIFGYQYSYSDESYYMLINMAGRPQLPGQYDLRDSGRVSAIRDQGSTSTCWACASLEALESSLLPYKTDIYSVDKMISDNSFDLTEDDGGDYTMALAYLTSWQGPVTEESDGGHLIDNITSSDGTANPVHLQEALFYDSEDLDGIKWAVYRYGGVSTSIYASVSTSNLTQSTSYNRATNSYCYTGNKKPNHDVVIIGWDDKYPASAFSENVPGNGAFICQNSWGSGFGDNGIFYISYYDSNIGNQAVCYSGVDTQNTYKYIYQSDLCGWVGQVGYGNEWAYGANVFTADGDMTIDAAGFYALDEDSSYEVYFVANYENSSSLAHRELVASGSLEDAGYFTIHFDSTKEVVAGESFAIILYINTPGITRPMAVEYAADGMSKAVDLTDGNGFISSNGLDWESAEDTASANLCIKAYGNDVMEVHK